MHINAAIDLLDAFVRYAHNVELDEFKKLYSPAATEEYLLEKYKYMQKNLGAFFGELDTEHREKLIKLIEERYWKKEGIMLNIEEHSDE